MRKLCVSVLSLCLASGLVWAGDYSEEEWNPPLEETLDAQEIGLADVEAAEEEAGWDKEEEVTTDASTDAFVSILENEALTDPAVASFTDMVAAEDGERYVLESVCEYLEGHEDKAELKLVLSDAGEGLDPEKLYLRCQSSDTSQEGSFIIPLQGSPEAAMPEMVLTIDGKTYTLVSGDHYNPEEELEYHALSQEENLVNEAITLRFPKGLLKREEYVKIHEDGLEKVVTPFAFELELDKLTFDLAEVSLVFNYIDRIETGDNQISLSFGNEKEETEKRNLFTLSDQLVEENLPTADAKAEKEEMREIKMK